MVHVANHKLVNMIDDYGFYFLFFRAHASIRMKTDSPELRKVFFTRIQLCNETMEPLFVAVVVSVVVVCI
jgi:hypothetical protein